VLLGTKCLSARSGRPVKGMVLLLPSQPERVPPPSSTGPASRIRGWHTLSCKEVGVLMRHKVPRGTDTPGNACYTRYLQETAIA
jgi:hypothetical protein